MYLKTSCPGLRSCVLLGYKERNCFMNRKKYGVILIFVMIIAVFVYAIGCTSQIENLKKENEKLRSESTEEYKQRVNILTSDLMKAQQLLRGSEKNNESEVKAAAEFFLKSFYDNDNSSEYDQLSRIKALVSEKVYTSLLPDSGDNPSDPYNANGITYKSWITDIQSYYSYTTETTAEVFIYCTLNVQSGYTVNTSTPLIFSATMDCSSGTWIISEIHENRTIRLN